MLSCIIHYPYHSLCLSLCWLYCDEQGVYITRWNLSAEYWWFCSSLILQRIENERDLTIFSVAHSANMLDFMWVVNKFLCLSRVNLLDVPKMYQFPLKAFGLFKNSMQIIDNHHSEPNISTPLPYSIK